MPSAMYTSKQLEQSDEPVTGINITPLVDVCLTLVIIFMVTAPILSDPVFKVTLPVARTKEGEETEKITVTISKEGRMAINEKEFKSYDELAKNLKDTLEKSSTKYVIFMADEEVTYGKLTDLMYLAKEYGALSMTIATEQGRANGHK